MSCPTTKKNHTAQPLGRAEILMRRVVRQKCALGGVTLPLAGSKATCVCGPAKVAKSKSRPRASRACLSLVPCEQNQNWRSSCTPSRDTA